MIIHTKLVVFVPRSETDISKCLFDPTLMEYPKILNLSFIVVVYRYSEELIPSHPCLKLVSNSEQCLSRHVSRRLITMEKVKENKVKYK